MDSTARTDVDRLPSEGAKQWEEAVRERPYQARVFGPPSWLVAERAGPKPSAEAIGKAVAALRREYGLEAPVPRRADKGPHPAAHVEGECAYCAPESVPTQDVSRQGVPTLCATCHQAPREGRNRQCSACRKAAYREREA